jgi:hypothetical protein
MTGEQVESLHPHILKQVDAASVMAKLLGVSTGDVLRALAKAERKLVPQGHVDLVSYAVTSANDAGVK